MSEQITVWVGTVMATSNGHVEDDRVAVAFEGEQLGQMTRYGTGRNGGLTDTRGVTETLYRASDGRLVVHVEDWSRWQGEPNVERLIEVTEADLSVGGAFERLGAECGFGRPLTLDEALSRSLPGNNEVG